MNGRSGRPGPGGLASPARRRFVQAGSTLAAGVLLAPATRVSAMARASAPGLREFRLQAGAATVALHGPAHAALPAWGYNGAVPGPVLRARQGDRLRVVVDNRLEQPTTVHWHGLRLPNAMDGVPHVTQAPIGPGGRFVYEFPLPDAGTFWYHPHLLGEEQVGRGLYGALIVDESDPPVVDRDVLWMLDDWRLARDGSLAEQFGHWHDRSHAGRIGNRVTINGLPPQSLDLRQGERVRLRLVNAANARHFALTFGGHRPWVIALDGHPHGPVRLGPHEPLILAPANRADLVIDGEADPDRDHVVRDQFYRGMGYELTRITYRGGRLRPSGDREPPALSPNPLPVPDPRAARSYEITLDGGMMGDMRGLTVAGGAATGGGRMAGMMSRSGLMWGMNGIAAAHHDLEPIVVLEHGQACVLRIDNRTAWHHPMHLHGHAFRLLRRDGEPLARPEWRDTVTLAPRESVDVAFVADNPGDWMFHCHVLEHQAGGMMSLLRVREPTGKED